MHNTWTPHACPNNLGFIMKKMHVYACGTSDSMSDCHACIVKMNKFQLFWIIYITCPYILQEKSSTGSVYIPIYQYFKRYFKVWNLHRNTELDKQNLGVTVCGRWLRENRAWHARSIDALLTEILSLASKSCSYKTLGSRVHCHGGCCEIKS